MELSEAEVQLYDRQIRLWGVEAQQRIRQSQVLLIRLTNYHAEIGKNLAAAGFSLILCDDRKYTDCPAGSLVIPSSENENTEASIAEVYVMRLRSMNSFIKLSVIKEDEVVDVIKSGCVNAVAIPSEEALFENVVGSLSPDVMIVTTTLTEGGVVLMYSCTKSGSAWSLLPTQIMEAASNLKTSSKNRCTEAIKKLARHELSLTNKALPSFYAAIVGGSITQEVRKFISDDMSKVDYNCAYLDYQDSSMSVCHMGGDLPDKEAEEKTTPLVIAEVDD